VLAVFAVLFTVACVEVGTGPTEVGGDGSGYLGMGTSEALTAPSSLKVATLNVACPLPGGCSRAKFQEIAEAIKGLDIVIVQEAFWDDHHVQLAKMAGFSFYVRGPEKISGRTGSGGTVILSRFPFQEYSDEVFDQCASTDCYASKGFQVARLRLGGGLRLTVINTHMNTSGAPDSVLDFDYVQTAQMKQIVDYVRSQERSADELTLFGGDLNFSDEERFYNEAARAELTSYFRDRRGMIPVSGTWQVDQIWVGGSSRVQITASNPELVKVPSDHFLITVRLGLTSR